MAAILGRNENIKFLLASLRLLTNSINPSNNPLQRACCGIQKPMTLKIVPKATCDSESILYSIYIPKYTSENRPMREKGKPEQQLWCGFQNY